MGSDRSGTGNDRYPELEEDDDPAFWTPAEAARKAHYEMWDKDDDDLCDTENDDVEG